MVSINDWWIFHCKLGLSCRTWSHHQHNNYDSNDDAGDDGHGDQDGVPQDVTQALACLTLICYWGNQTKTSSFFSLVPEQQVSLKEAKLAFTQRCLVPRRRPQPIWLLSL